MINLYRKVFIWYECKIMDFGNGLVKVKIKHFTMHNWYKVIVILFLSMSSLTCYIYTFEWAFWIRHVAAGTSQYRKLNSVQSSVLNQIIIFYFPFEMWRSTKKKRTKITLKPFNMVFYSLIPFAITAATRRSFISLWKPSRKHLITKTGFNLVPCNCRYAHHILY